MTDKDLVKKCMLAKRPVNKVLAKKGCNIPSWVKWDENHPDFQLLLVQLEHAIPMIRKAVEEGYLKDKIEYGESTYESGYAMAKQEVAEEKKREFIEWGEEICTDHFKDVHRVGGPKRCRCTECWQALKEEK